MISMILILILLLTSLDVISFVNAIQGISYKQGSWSFAQVLRIPEAGTTYGDTPSFVGKN